MLKVYKKYQEWILDGETIDHDSWCEIRDESQAINYSRTYPVMKCIQEDHLPMPYHKHRKQYVITTFFGSYKVKEDSILEEKFSYRDIDDIISFEQLQKLPAAKVIAYLKERGITTIGK